jgi:DNA-binding NarL/FixJ family response regulator
LQEKARRARQLVAFGFEQLQRAQRSIARGGYGAQAMSTTSHPDLIHVLSVDDHPLIREGVAAILEAEPDMKLVGEATNGREAIEAFRQHRPDVTLMDLRMPDVGGAEAIVRIRSEFPSARIIVLTSYTGDVQVLGALNAGAIGYLLKNMLRRDMLDAIRAAHAGMRRIPPEIAAEIAEHASDAALTARELDVLRCVAAGRSNKAIATELKISDSTVKAHLKAILAKLDADGRTHGVMIAVKRGIIDI